MDKLQFLNDHPLPFAKVLGLKFVAASETGVKAEMVVKPELCTRPDILHGGAVMGLDLAIVFELLGLGVVAFGALCAWVASRETLPQGWARVIFAADIVWVVGSVLVLALPATWTMAGFIGIVVVALIVADFVILEYLGLRRLGTANS